MVRSACAAFRRVDGGQYLMIYEELCSQSFDGSRFATV